MIRLLNIQIQSKIIDFILKNKVASTGDIQKYLGDVTRPTLSRYLKELKDFEIIDTVGSGRSTKYCISTDGIKSYPFDLSLYDAPYQTSVPITFNHTRFQISQELFNDGEKSLLDNANKLYGEWKRDTAKEYKDSALERCAIEFSWKSSKIEGNTYTLLETENLIKNKEEVKGKSHDDAVMILNQKKVFDLIYKENFFSDMSLATLIDMHALLMKDLGVSRGVRKSHVGIIGTQYTPLTFESQLEEALEELFSLLTKIKNPLEKAIVALASIAYIQPFVDGNKRTSRHFANFILHTHNLSPVAWRTVNEVEYKKAMIAFYELGNIRPITELWVRNYHETVTTFFKT